MHALHPLEYLVANGFTHLDLRLVHQRFDCQPRQESAWTGIATPGGAGFRS